MVIDIGSMSQVLEPFLPDQHQQMPENSLFADVAPLRGIGKKISPSHLCGVND